MVKRILLFGDPEGVQQVTKVLSQNAILAIVGATIRSEQRGALEKLAGRHEVRLLVQPKRNSPEYPGFVDEVRGLDPDLMLVNSYAMRVGVELLDLPRFGCVNVHGGLLPEYRGSNPIQWALLNDEVETGVTMHYMTEEFDQGDIIAQRRVAISFEDTWLDVRGRLQRATEGLLEEELPKILSCTNARSPQDESRARYYRRRSAEDGLVDWHRPVRDLYNLIRALVKPHPGAYYDLASQRMILDRYLSIREVTALKYGDSGRQILRGTDVMLFPVESLASETCRRGKGSNERVEFSIRACASGETLGRCELSSIDFVNSVGEMRIRPADGVVAEGLCHTAVEPLSEFAGNDLRLKHLMYRVERDEERLLESLARAGFVREDVSETDQTTTADGTPGMIWRRRTV
jgi:methionyl-tRNA formyltransferase